MPAITVESLYKVGKWGPLDNYECKTCPFATLELEHIREHVLTHIPDPPATTRPITAVLFDDKDKPITQVPVTRSGPPPLPKQRSR